MFAIVVVSTLGRVLEAVDGWAVVVTFGEEGDDGVDGSRYAGGGGATGHWGSNAIGAGLTPNTSRRDTLHAPLVATCLSCHTIWRRCRCSRSTIPLDGAVLIVVVGARVFCCCCWIESMWKRSWSDDDVGWGCGIDSMEAMDPIPICCPPSNDLTNWTAPPSPPPKDVSPIVPTCDTSSPFLLLLLLG